MNLAFQYVTAQGNSYQPKKSFLKWFGRWIAIIGIVTVLFVVPGCQHNQSSSVDNDTQQTANPQETDKIIVANPVDLDKIVAITKFRSCFGHEFGKTTAFEGNEAISSLKHYFVPDEKYLDTNNAVPVYAPFNGTIIYVEAGTEQFLIEQKPYGGWVFGFTHIAIKDGLKMGSEVKAGELVGYANLTNCHAFDINLQANKNSGNANAFNISFQKNKPSGVKNYDWLNNYESIFNHMSDDVYAQFVAKGITKENIIIPKSTRDADPCPCDRPADVENSSYCMFAPIPYSDPNNAVLLK